MCGETQWGDEMNWQKVVPAILLLAACGQGELTLLSEEYDKPELGDAEQRFSSALATELDFEFDGQVVASSSYDARASIDEQLLFSIGHLNGDRGVGRLDRVELSSMQSAAQPDGTVLVSYHAKLPVAWGSKTQLPTNYALTLPKKVDYASVEAFTQKYNPSCVEAGAHDVDSGSIWYYYRPKRSGCALDPAEVVKFTATVTKSAENTTGKYPEYHKVWEDGVLRVVAIFGKYEDGATSGDVGISGYNSFVRSVRAELASGSLVTTPAVVPTDPGVNTPDITFEATLPDGKQVVVNALLVDNVRTAGPVFDARYKELSTRADLIAYNGHAGLGANVRALARKGAFEAGRYLIVFMDGCDTFAYVDGYLAQTRAAVNPDDPTGTKYMDIVTNAMPAYFSSMPRSSMALIRALMKSDAPLTYEQIFKGIDASQVVLVTGEEDNAYYPGYQPTKSYEQREQGAVARNQELGYQTPSVPAGKYVVTLTESSAAPGGDADLYVKVGSAPTLSSYDCRPYLGSSNESCVVTLTQDAPIFVVVRGYAAQSDFQLTIRGESTPPKPTTWSGLDESGTLAKGKTVSFQTPLLDAGRYRFTMTGTGDADLYVRAGVAPTTSAYDCRPYANGSAEECVLNLATPNVVHVMVRGYSTSSEFRLVGKAE